MLSIGKIALGQHRYYERQVAGGGDDYYSGRGEAPGVWAGAGAEALGLRGHVSAEQFGALIAGLDPRDPSVRLRASERDPKVAALDLTFSAPKSLSVLFAVAPEEVSRELIACHEEAVGASLGYLEEEAVMVRRGEGGKHVERAEGLIAAAYRHRMSRALDPQLHTHVVAANLARGSDGRFTALHGAPLYQAAKTAGFLYQAHLRALVRERLGLQWGEVHKGASELEGVKRPVIEHFSKRREEMLREARQGGIGLGTKAAAESAALATRDRKQYGIETHTWREEIRARAAELGLGAEELGALIREGWERPGGLIAAKRAGDTLNHYRRVLRGVFGTHPMSPALAWKWNAQKVESEGKLSFYTPAQVRRLIAEAYSPLDAAIFTLATEAGPRLSEIRGLKVINVDFEVGVIRFEDGFTTSGGHAGNKGRRVRSVPLSSNVRAALTPYCVGNAPDALVFEHEGKPGEPICGTSLYRRFVSAAKRAGLPVLRFHDLRHSFGTQAIRAFNIYEVQRMMGHRHITTTERYLHYAPDPDAAAKLSGLWGGSVGEDGADVVPIRTAA